jgi:CRP/FNR family transcriptional regulator, nitrogen oxide reductase regulator
VPPSVEALLRANPLYVRLSEADRRRLTELSSVRTYAKGDVVFHEGDDSEWLFTIAEGRIKVVKMLPAGKEMIVEILGPGDPLGAVAAYEARPYPASAVAMEPALCLALRRGPLFALLETSPSLTRGLLASLSVRLVQLTQRLAEVTGSRVEERFAQLFLKLAERLGQRQAAAVFIPLHLSRQDLADLTGTTIETCIRVMSRWGREGVVNTEPDGFRVADLETLRALVR